MRVRPAFLLAAGSTLLACIATPAQAEQTNLVQCYARWKSGNNFWSGYDEIDLSSGDSINEWSVAMEKLRNQFREAVERHGRPSEVPSSAVLHDISCSAGRSYKWSGSGSSENGYGGTSYYTPFKVISAASTPTPRSKAAEEDQKNSVSEPQELEQSKADREAEWQRKQKEYELAKAAQEKQVEEYKRAQDEVARRKEEQRLAVEKAQAEYRALAAEHARKLDEMERAAKLAEETYRRQLRGEMAEPKSSYRTFAVKGDSGATRAEAEQKFLAEMNARYSDRSNLTYQCVDILGRWVCNGSVEFGSRPDKKMAPLDDRPVKASSQ